VNTLDDTRPAVTADPDGQDLDPEIARYVARLYLTRMTPSVLRDRADRVAAGRSDPEFREMFLAIADAMDELLAEGFDPAAYAESLRPGDAGPVSGIPASGIRAQSPAEED
jgi:hypothetical protein